MSNTIHRFKQGDNYIVLDINSGGVHVVDKMVYDILGLLTPPLSAEMPETLVKVLTEYPEDELRECYAEIYSLYMDKILFSTDEYRRYAEMSIKAPIKAMCLHVAHTCVLVKEKAVDTVVCRLLITAVVDTATCDNDNVRALTDVKIVIHDLLQPRLADNDGDMHAFVFRTGFDEDVNPRLSVRFRHNVNVRGRVSAQAFAVAANVECALGGTVQISDLQ